MQACIAHPKLALAEPRPVLQKASHQPWCSSPALVRSLRRIEHPHCCRARVANRVCYRRREQVNDAPGELLGEDDGAVDASRGVGVVGEVCRPTQTVMWRWSSTSPTVYERSRVLTSRLVGESAYD
jgi:hypothetical protein